MQLERLWNNSMYLYYFYKRFLFKIKNDGSNNNRRQWCLYNVLYNNVQEAITFYYLLYMIFRRFFFTHIICYFLLVLQGQYFLFAAKHSSAYSVDRIKLWYSNFIRDLSVFFMTWVLNQLLVNFSNIRQISKLSQCWSFFFSKYTLQIL